MAQEVSVKFIFCLKIVLIFPLYKKIYIHQNENSSVHVLNIDISHKWLKFENDRLSRFKDVVGTDFKNVFMRKTRSKFYLSSYIRLTLLHSNCTFP